MEKSDVKEWTFNYKAWESKYFLMGSDKEENVRHRIGFLTLLFNVADHREEVIADLRYRNLNYALLIFGGLIAIRLRYQTVSSYSLLSSLALLLIVVVFCLLDRRYHLFIHGWRRTAKTLAGCLCEMINNPIKDKEVKRYYKEGESEAELLHLQPLIYYLLIGGAAINLVLELKWSIQ